MTDDALMASVRAGDVERVRALLDAGADLHARDEHEWTALCWASGAGHAAIVRVLLERGADPCAVGVDRRTPYQIALAAGRVEVARFLATVEAARGGDAVAKSSGQAAGRPYCRAYQLRDVRRFAAWPGSNADPAEDDDSVVFVHRDFSVTRTARAGEGVIFDGASAEWARFCGEELGFEPPGDFEWLPGTESVVTGSSGRSGRP